MRALHAHSDDEIVYRILDALTEAFCRVLRALEAEVTRLENERVRAPDPGATAARSSICAAACSACCR